MVHICGLLAGGLCEEKLRKWGLSVFLLLAGLSLVGGRGHSRRRSLALRRHHRDTLAVLLHRTDGDYPLLLSILIVCLVAFAHLNLS